MIKEHRYLITSKPNKPFLTEYFGPESNFDVSISMIVYDLKELKFTIDGEIWVDINVVDF